MLHRNSQPPAKASYSPTGELSVHSVFNTIQGEGPHVGRPAVFVRLAGCNLQCPFCDTEYTQGATTLGVEEIIDVIDDQAGENCNARPLVVITGGEPLRQNIAPLCSALLALGVAVQVETNGTLYSHTLPAGVDVVCSPKTGKVAAHLWPRITALKYVIRAGTVDPDDGLPLTALGHPANPRLARPDPSFTGVVYVQPMDEGNADRNAANLAAAKASAMRFGYTLGVQLHKNIGVP